MITLLLISLLIFIAYNVFVISYFGIPYSISDTYYKLKGKSWVFTAMCWGVVGTLLPALLDMTPDSYKFTAFLACAGLLFVGSAPQFKLSLTGGVHYASAAICVIFSQLWVALTLWWILLPVWIIFASYILYGMIRHSDFSSGNVYFKESKPMFWCEIAAIGATYISMFLKLN